MKTQFVKGDKKMWFSFFWNLHALDKPKIEHTIVYESKIIPLFCSGFLASGKNEWKRIRAKRWQTTHYPRDPNQANSEIADGAREKTQSLRRRKIGEKRRAVDPFRRKTSKPLVGVAAADN